MDDRRTAKIISNRCATSESKVIKLSRRSASKGNCRSSIHHEHSFNMNEYSSTTSKHKTTSPNTKTISVSKLCSYSAQNYEQKTDNLEKQSASSYSKNDGKGRHIREEEIMSATFARIQRHNIVQDSDAILNHHNSKMPNTPINEMTCQEGHNQLESYKRKKRRKKTSCFGCTRLCVFVATFASMSIGVIIAATIVAVLSKSHTTIPSTTITTTTTTTATTDTTTSATTTTTETTTMTYAPTGIYALNISTCATWDQNGITVAGNENGSSGADSRSLYTPVTIFIDNNYTLYICDRDNHRIMKYFVNATTGIVAAGITGSPGSNATQLNQPKGVAVDQMGAIIVADSNNYRIQRFPLGSIDGITIGINSSTTPLGTTRDLHIDVNNVVYVTDSDNSRIVKFLPGNQIGIIVAGTAGAGSAANQFQGPFGTFVNESQILYIADSNNQRIQRWLAGATSGTTVAGISGSSGSSLTQLSNPLAVVLDNNEYMYIADTNNNRIVRWTDNYAAGGTCIVGCTGTAGNGPTQLNGPRDLKFDASGNLYVSDQGNNRVQKYLIQYTNCSSSGR